MADRRSLSREEIRNLETRGCTADDWGGVKVASPFDADRFRNVRFHGQVELGVFDADTAPAVGPSRKTGVYDSTLFDCTVGSNAFVSHVRTLSRYDIEPNAYVENVDALVVDGRSSFGNGTEIEILNEAGGRTLVLYDRLSAQIAYVLTFYRHDMDFADALEALVRAYVKEQESDRGVLHRACTVCNCGTMRNVRIGPSGVVCGALLVEDATIESSDSDPTRLGEGVAVRHSIVLSGTTIDGSALIDRCFVGQGVALGKQFSAENSAFFANCEGFHGEAVSLFAGPYTVTHHKSTLLIAGLFSFFNAGSGTNQSNHMYKLGPVHQGIVERGSKTSSSSYLLWPSRIGAFSALVGKHFNNLDTAHLPFSYITEEEGRSVVTPAMNLLTVGTRRDSGKWPARDRRKASEKLDLIHFELFNPYTVGRMVCGLGVLRELSERATKKQEFVSYGGASVRRLLLKTCSRYYELGIKVYLGARLSAQLAQADGATTWPGMLAALMPASVAGSGDWVDVCGLLAPSGSINSLVSAVRSGQCKSIREVEDRFQALYDSYAQLEWEWCFRLLLGRLGVSADGLKPEHLIGVLRDWETNAVRLNNMIAGDAQKEFSGNARIGYGIDGGPEDQERDFEEVRGSCQDNAFVKELLEESDAVSRRAQECIALLKGMNNE